MWVQGNWPARVRTRKSEQRHKQSPTISVGDVGWQRLDSRLGKKPIGEDG